MPLPMASPSGSAQSRRRSRRRPRLHVGGLTALKAGDREKRTAETQARKTEPQASDGGRQTHHRHCKRLVLRRHGARAGSSLRKGEKVVSTADDSRDFVRIFATAVATLTRTHYRVRDEHDLERQDSLVPQLLHSITPTAPPSSSAPAPSFFFARLCMLPPLPVPYMMRLLNAGQPSQHVCPPEPLQTPPPGHEPGGGSALSREATGWVAGAAGAGVAAFDGPATGAGAGARAGSVDGPACGGPASAGGGG